MFCCLGDMYANMYVCMHVYMTCTHNKQTRIRTLPGLRVCVCKYMGMRMTFCLTKLMWHVLMHILCYKKENHIMWMFCYM